MTSNSLRDKDLASVLHPYTHLGRHREKGPLIITRGEGVRVFDDAGNDYIEGMAGLWCTALGFSEPRLAEAARRQMERLPFYHMFNHKSHETGIELASKLLELAPVPMSKVFFANSGSEANDTAVKLVWYVNNALGRPKKKKIIARRKGYHGVTVATASLTGLPANQRDFDLPIAGILHTECPHHYAEALPGETERDFSARLADALDTMIEAEGPDTVAAFFAEPVMGAGGVIVPPEGYFEMVQAVLRKHDVMFVADEVICGFGRTGRMFGSQTYGLAPDMITCAKGLSSAYLPISALMVSEGIWQALVAQSDKIGLFGHGYTYSAHPVAAAVALETLDIFAERDILGHVAQVGPRLQAGLKALESHPLVGQARGVGLIGALELVADKNTRAHFPPERGIGAQVVEAAQNAGVILRAMMGDSIAFSPPLIITEDEIDEMLAMTRAALDEVAGRVLAS
ncbi:MAG: aspartate aminotransferase family protein [Alphaproteobacteria bacterium]|nr:aspartate aminotransferase family protein [Alphaproteobacteria bacterium]